MRLAVSVVGWARFLAHADSGAMNNAVLEYTCCMSTKKCAYPWPLAMIKRSKFRKNIGGGYGTRRPFLRRQIFGKLGRFNYYKSQHRHC
jgi:hypothetical protein